MKNYHFTTKIIFTLFKWVALDVTFRPITDSLFKLSIDRKVNCSMPGVLMNFSFLKLFNIWLSVFDERVFDEKAKKLIDPKLMKPSVLTKQQIKSSGDLLGDLVRWVPGFDQLFHKHSNLPEMVLAYKTNIFDNLHEMENYLRAAMTTKPNRHN